MKAATILALAAGFAAAAPAAAPIEKAEVEETHYLRKRLGTLGVAIVGGVISGSISTAIVGTASGIAAKQINDFIDAIENWDQVREEFTQRTVEEIFKERPGEEYAAICYVSRAPGSSREKEEGEIGVADGSCRTWAIASRSPTRSSTVASSSSSPAR